MKTFNLYLLAVICFLVFNNLYAQYELDVQVSTDKQQYHLNDVIEITVTATNYTSDPILLEFSTTCQTSYFVDYTQFWDGQTFIICLPVITGKTIPANGSFTWTHHHDLALSPLYPGQHIIYGSIDEMYYPMFSNSIGIEILNSYVQQDFEFENFSDYQWDLPLVQQAHSQGKFYWQTWNDLPGSDEDPMVNLDFSVSNSRMLLIENDDDALLLLGDKTSGIWDIEFEIFIRDSSLGYFNVLQEFDGDESLWGMQVFFDTAGTGYLNGPGFLKYFDYAYDEWIPVKCHFDLNNDLAFVKVNDQHLRTWQWSDGLSGTSKKQLAAINFYGWNGCCDAGYYIDNISLTESGEISNRLLGSSSSIYSIENNWLNQICVNNELNTVAFIHRNNEHKFGGHNGHLRYDISTDGGLNWQTDQGVLNPASTILTRAIHPQISFYNPENNTDPENVSLVYFAPYADSTQLQGFNYGTYALNEDTLTEHYDTTFDFEYLPGGMLQAENGTYFLVDKKYPYSKIRIFKGAWQNDDVQWEICDSIDLAESGYYVYSWSIAFAPDNTTGWIAAVQKVLNYNRLDEKIIVYLSQTTDGGASWSDPIALDFEDFPQITNEIPDPYIASTISNADFDLSVDANGNPHLLIDVFAKDPSGNSYYVSVYHRLFAFRYQESSWIANEICGLETYGSSLYPDNHWELRNRLHICRNDSADRIFFTWTDSDSTHTENYLNSLPNFYALGYDVDTDEWTDIKPLTKGTDLDEKIFAATVSPIAITGDNVYEIPVAYAQLSESGQPTDPVDYYYLNGVNFSMGNCPTAYAGEDATICEGESHLLSAAVATDYSSLEWSGGAGDFSNSNALTPTYTPTASEAGTDVELCLKALPVDPCNTYAEDCMTLTITPQPIVFAGNDTIVLEYNPALFLETALAENYTSVQWTTDGDGIFFLPEELSGVYIPGPLDFENGSVNLCLTAYPLEGCQDSVTDCFTVTCLPLNENFLGPDTTVCENIIHVNLPCDIGSEQWVDFELTHTGDGYFDGYAPFECPWAADYYPGPGDLVSGSIEFCLELFYDDPVSYSVSDCKTFSFQPVPSVDAGPDQYICEDDFVVLNGMSENADGCHWLSTGTGYFDDIGTLSTNYWPSAADIEAGEVTLCLICDPISPCENTVMDCLDLYIQKKPSVDINEENATICEDVDFNTADLTISVDNESAVIWTTAGDGTFADAAMVETMYAPGAGDITNGATLLTLTASSIDPCTTSATDEFILVFQLLPFVNILPNDTTICETDCFDFYGLVEAENYSEISWCCGNGFEPNVLWPLYCPTPEQLMQGFIELLIVVSPVSPCSGPGAVDYINIYFQDTPIVDAGPDVSVCEDVAMIAINGNSYNSSGCFWTSPSPGFFEDPTNPSTNYYPSFLDIQNGSVTLCIYCEPEPPCTLGAEDCMTITFIPTPQVYAGEDATICDTGNGFELDDAFAINYSSLEWTTTGDGFFSDPNTENPVYYPGNQDMSNGGADLCLEAFPLAGCTVSDMSCLVLTILPEPTIGNMVDFTVCEGEPVLLYDVVETGAVSFQWSGGVGFFDDPSLLNPQYDPAPAETGTTVELCLTAYAPEICNDSITECVEVFIQPKPIVDAGDDQTVCQNQSVNLAGFVENGADAYWLTSGTGSFLDQGNPVTEYFPSWGDIAGGEVTLCLIGEPLSPCTLDVMSCMEVSFVLLPFVDLWMEEEICEGDSFQPFPMLMENAESWWWFTYGDGTFDDDYALEPVYYPGPEDIENGMADLCLVAFPIAPCEIAFESCMTLIIHKNPTVDAGPDGTICEDMDYCFNDAIAQNCSYIQWYSSGDGFFLDNNNINTCYLPGPMDIEMGGEIFLTVEGQPEFPCLVYAYDDVMLTIVKNPEVMVDGDEMICEGDDVQLFGSSIFSTSCSWYSSGSGTFSDPFNDFTTYSPSLEDIQSGWVDLCYDCQPVSPCGQPGFDCIYTTILSKPIVDAGADQYISLSDSVIVTGNAENYEFVGWETDGDGDFNDPLQLSTAYHPGAGDIQNNEVILSLVSMSGDPCFFEVADEITVFIGENQIVELNEGWNGISTYLSPFLTEPELFFHPIEQQLVLMQNFSQIYWPGYNINTIGTFNHETGYAIKVSSNVDFPVLGIESDLSTFEFSEGWNIMPVCSKCPVSVFSFLPEMGASFMLAYEIGGSAVLWPAQGIYTLQTFMPGKAYMVRMNEVASFTFPGCPKYSMQVGLEYPGERNEIIASPWGKVVNTNGYHLVGLPVELVDNLFAPGDFIGVFSAEDILCGLVEVTENPSVLIVNIDDISTGVKDGMEELEEMIFKGYSYEEKQAFPLDVSWDLNYPSHDGVFSSNGVSVLKNLEMATGTEKYFSPESLFIFPNPTTGTISLSGTDAAEISEISVLNAIGEKVLVTKQLQNGHIDLSAFPSGVYYIRITIADQIISKKVVVRK